MKIVWLDLETTGLDPHHCQILEVAVAVAEFNDPFNAVHVYNDVLWFPLNPSKAPHEFAYLSRQAWDKLPPHVSDMHTKSGLFEECAQKGKWLNQVDEQLSLLVPWIKDPEERPALGGSSIGFDWSFIMVHLPLLARNMSHRLHDVKRYDVSTLKLYCQSRGMPVIPKVEAHRAQADIMESIRHGKLCDEWLRKRGDQ